MAVGKSNQVSGKKFSTKIILKEGNQFLDKPYWGFTAKQPDGSYEPFTQAQLLETFGIEGPIYDLAGDLISVETRLGEYEGDPIHNITLGLQDLERGETYYAGFISNNNLGRSIANSLLNLKAFNNVQLGLWGQFSKANNKTYPACSIRQGDSRDTVKWKFDPKTDVLLQPREFTGKGDKVQKDWTKVDEFLFAELKKLGSILNDARGIRSDTKTVNEPKAVQESAAQHVEPIKGPKKTKTKTTPVAAPVTQENLEEDAPF